MWKNLPPNFTEAMICSCKCAFYASCVQEVMANVCPTTVEDFVLFP
ncbi:DUF1272 domain-containing protein [Kaarinaea lacus]